ncbi:MAG: hypothetical protein H8E44_08135 [Planctomycetes bacterium]|nr:hypothetical protein [Planctomycetota bacterium]
MLRTTRIQVAAVAAIVLAAGTAAAQPAVVRSPQGAGGAQPLVVRSGGQGVAGQGYSGYVSPWSGSIRYLYMQSVKDDLELVEEQVQKINQIRTDLQKETSEMYKNMRDLSREERMEKYRKLNEELAEKIEKQIKEVLLREQMERLNQISLQMRLRSYYSLGQALSGDDLVESLDISERQKRELREVQQEVQTEMREKINEFYAKIREEAQEKILKVLSQKQRDKLEKLKGEKFEYQYQQPKK